MKKTREFRRERDFRDCERCINEREVEGFCREKDGSWRVRDKMKR